MDFHFLFFSFFLIITVFGVKSLGGGFELELIHRDSPFSPLYNQSATSGERAIDAALRSLARFSRIRTNGSSIESVIRSGDGTFLIKLLVGTPPTTAYAILDTGSDLTWIQCAPCVTCFGQNTSLFDRRISATYHNLSCDSRPCQSLRDVSSANCSIPRDECRYSYSYEDGSVSGGVLATETFLFQTVSGSVTKATDFVFGCGYNNQLSSRAGGSGIIGLGRGLISLTSQLGSKMEKKFSYCLPKSANISSKFKFGMKASSSAAKMVSTPLLTDEMTPSLYLVTLEGITLGGKEMRTDSGEGNTIIDSGTTLNILELGLYYFVVSTLRDLINLTAIVDPSLGLGLCYPTKPFRELPEQTLIFHFTGADVKLQYVNMFIEVNNLTCFSMTSSPDSYSSSNLLGNIAQINFEIEFDLDRNVVSFAPANCPDYPLTGDGAKAYTTRYILLSFVLPLFWFMY